MSTLTVYFQTKETKLTDKNYLGEGGEGVIYLKNNVIYKIYHNHKDVISAQKLSELSVLTLDNIIAPLDFVYNDKGLPIGYAMKYVDDTSPLARLITTSFRNRNNITPDMASKLVEKMATTIHFIHQKDILIIDGNEFNYLVDNGTFVVPYFIDVDSYQTKSSPAKVIMPSIRDWQAKAFSTASDWYSFAIVDSSQRRRFSQASSSTTTYRFVTMGSKSTTTAKTSSSASRRGKHAALGMHKKNAIKQTTSSSRVYRIANLSYTRGCFVCERRASKGWYHTRIRTCDNYNWSNFRKPKDWKSWRHHQAYNRL